MVIYCLKCSKKQKHMRFAKTNKRNLMFMSKYMVCDSKKFDLSKKTQEASELLSNLELELH